jgi:hypothetical protein
VPGEARGHERRPEPQQQGALAGSGAADHDLVRADPVGGQPRERRLWVTDRADDRAGYEVTTGSEQRDGSRRGNPGSCCADLMPPLAGVEAGGRGGRAATSPGRHRGEAARPCPAGREQPERQGGGRHQDGCGDVVAVPPDREPREPGRIGRRPERVPGEGCGSEPDRDHRQAPGCGPVQPPGPPAVAPGDGHTDCGDQGDREQADGDRQHDASADEAGARSQHRARAACHQARLR